jgi:hypothetical protein
MKLNLYRRHRLECESGKPGDSRSMEPEERRKGWGRKCLCQIHVSGTLDGRFSRKACRVRKLVTLPGGIRESPHQDDHGAEHCPDPLTTPVSGPPGWAG